MLEIAAGSGGICQYAETMVQTLLELGLEDSFFIFYSPDMESTVKRLPHNANVKMIQLPQTFQNRVKKI